MRPVDTLLAKLDKVRDHGNGRFYACCPAHEDKNPSLAVTEGEDGTVLVHCCAGCSVLDVVSAVGLTLGDLFPENPDKRPVDRSKDLWREYLVLDMVRSAKRRGESINPTDLKRAELAIHRIKSVEAR